MPSAPKSSFLDRPITMDIQISLKTAEQLLHEGKEEEAADACWTVISHPNASATERAEAYLTLGNICFLLQPGHDGGHHGLGFYALALLHNPEETSAMANIAATFTNDGDRRSGHIDLALAKRFEWAENKLDQRTQESSDTEL